MMPSYDEQTVPSPNPLAQLVHLRRHRLAERHVANNLQACGARIGCGDGRLLTRLAPKLPGAKLFSFDPYGKPSTGYELLASFDQVGAQTHDLVTAFEVLEHLEEEQIAEFIQLGLTRLKPDGEIVVSVPNMPGPALIPKVLNAHYVKKSTWRYSLGATAGAVLVLRSDERYRGKGYLTHKGFYWRVIRDRLGGKPLSQELSLFAALPRGLNSHWLGVCESKPSDSAAPLGDC